MNPSVLLLVAAQVLLTSSATVMSIWAGMPLLATISFAVLGASAIAAEVAPEAGGQWVWKYSVILAWLCTLVVPATLLLAKDEGFTFARFLDNYFATLAWLIAAVVLPASHRLMSPALKARWRLPVMAWAACGGVVWLGAAYSENRAGAFYVGLVISLALLILCHLWFRPPTAGIQILNTLILLLVGLPIANLFVQSDRGLKADPALRKRHYCYEAARKDRVAYARWWKFYLHQYELVEKAIYIPDPERRLPYRLRPNSEATLVQSRIRINSRGLRGGEIPAEKGKAYRIVALGESSTFGITLAREDCPWPELLERLIHERLQLARPVEVINTAVPGYTLEDNLYRFPKEILSLKPDMIISYHGINGFPLLYSGLPTIYQNRPPRYKERPLRLLADCEYRLKLMSYRRHETARLILHPPAVSDPMQTEYAQAYRNLVRICQTNGIRLVLANFSMAVNSRSDPDVIGFYQVAYPLAPWQIKANELHSLIVQTIAQQNPDVCLIDTHPRLDGVHENFLDLVHFSPEGDQRMAETMFQGIQNVLGQDLAFQ